jgi:YesN/AraC family two-component response regulator
VPLYAAKPIALLLVHISRADLNSILANHKQFGEMYILDMNRNVVVGTYEDEKFQKDMQALLENAPELSEDRGYFTAELDGKKMGVTFYRSGYNNWLYVSVTSLDEILSDSREIGRYTLYICAAILLLTLLLSLYSSRIINMPIKRWYGALLDFVSSQDQGSEIDVISLKLKSLLHSRRRMSDQLKQFFVTKLILGELRSGEIDEKMEAFEYAKHWKQIFVLVLEIDTLEGTGYREKDRDLLMFAINNIAAEIIPNQKRLETVVIKQSQVVVMGSEAEDSHPFRLEVSEKAEEIQKKISRYLRLQVSIGVSQKHSELRELSTGYLEGLEALKYRVRFERESILFFDEVQPNRELPFIFPMRLENELIDAIKLGEMDEIKQKLHEFLQEIYNKEADHRDYHIFLARLLSDLLRVGQEIGEIIPHDGTVSLFERLFELKTIAEIESWFMQTIIVPIAALFAEQKEKTHRLIAKQVCEIIHRDAETNLTLEMCAAQLNYHPVYVSRVFRQEMGVNFSDYLAGVRLGIAKKWLLETDMTVNEIAQKLHYSNSGNFIRYFKNMEGVTPGKYREQAGRRVV